jgi:ATP-dependent DNA ligase
VFYPLTVRKKALKKILPKSNTGRIRFTDHIAGKGKPLFEKLEALKLEGMVMKRKDSVYALSRLAEGPNLCGTCNHAEANRKLEVRFG